MPRQAEAWMRCADGIRLASRLWIPEGNGPWPVLLMRQPYGSAIASTVVYADPSWYCRHGFLVVVQDVRGRGDSEGRFGGFAQEAADGAAAVRWARRLEGSNGLVGTYGFSYQGLTQLLIAPPQRGEDQSGEPGGGVRIDPFPDCLAPAMCGLDERLHWATEGEAHWWHLGVGWALQLAAQEAQRRDDRDGWLEIRRALEDGSYLRDGLSLLDRHDPHGMGRLWLAADPACPEQWRTHAVAPELLRRPMLLIGGWHDPHLRGVLDLWRHSRAAGGHPQLCIGAWSHLDWNGGVDEEQLAFFRRHLGSPPAADPVPAGNRPAPLDPPEDGAEAPGVAARPPHAAPDGPRSDALLLVPADAAVPAVALQCVTVGVWLCDPPPDPADEARRGWALHSGGLAAIRCDEGELRAGMSGSGAVTLVHDPWRPVPGRGGHLGASPGVVERADLDARGDVACFTTLPLHAPLQLLGEPRLTIVAAADQPGFDLCAALSVLDAEEGRVRQLCTGLVRLRGRGCLDARQRRLSLQPLCASLRPGERLRLSLAGAAWPQIAVNPGDGTVPSGAVGPAHRVIRLTMELAASRLWLEPWTGAN